MAGFSVFMVNRVAMFLVLWFVAALCASAATMTATLDRQTIALGETTTLRLTIKDGQPASFPSVPPVANLQIQSAGNRLSSTTVINGKAESMLVFSYSVTPSKEGQFTIGPAQVVVSGQPLVSNPVKLTVSGNVQAAAVQQEAAFLRFSVPKKELFVGESIPVEVLLYYQDAKDLTMPKIEAEGFVLSQIPRPNQSRGQMGGVAYNLVVFRFAATPIKAGKLKLGPATCSLTLLFGPVDFFGRHTRGRPATLTAEAVELLVHPLPAAGKPDSFNGAVGKYHLSFSAAPTNLAAGDPITVRTRISGTGNLDALALPEQSSWQEFKTYPPTSKIESADALGLEGAKVFEQVVSPLHSGVKELPGLVFSYFDPDAKQYRTMKPPDVKLNVRASAAAPNPTILTETNDVPSESGAESKEMAHIKPHLGLVHAGDAILLEQKWFIALQALAPFVFAAAFLRRKQREHLEANPALIRKRAVGKTVDAGIAQLKQLAAENKKEEFYHLMFKLLQEQIGERLDLPSSGITEESVEDLSGLGLSAEVRQDVHGLFQAANQARYAGSTTKVELQQLADRSESCLCSVRELRKAGEK